jgi:hypothetical protein
MTEEINPLGMDSSDSKKIEDITTDLGVYLQSKGITKQNPDKEPVKDGHELNFAVYDEGPGFAIPVKESEQEKGEDLLVEMTSTLNSLTRFYDQNNPKAVKMLIDKGQELSLRGVRHLSLLDRQANQIKELQAEVSKTNRCIDVITADHKKRAFRTSSREAKG